MLSVVELGSNLDGNFGFKKLNCTGHEEKHLLLFISWKNLSVNWYALLTVIIPSVVIIIP